MTNTRASGSFEVDLKWQPPHDTVEGVGLARASLEKKFQGDLDAAGRADMLSAFTPVNGSAGYVAIERIVGTLQGRAGSFVLQHIGTMTRGEPSLTITVVPDSGTGGLAGIAGQMKIDIIEGKHFYTFDYRLGETTS